jgi:serine protease Do
MSLLVAIVGVASLAMAEEPAATPPQLPTPDKLFAGQLLAPKAFRAAVDKVLPSLVTIETFGGLSGGSRRGKMQGISRPGDGPTTGVIISADGYVVTSTFNFLRRPPVITVVRQDGTRHVATLLGRDETRKLCVLKIEGVNDLPVPEFVSPSELKIGAWAISVGVGYGDDEPMISAGIVSALNRVSGRAVQTDANISPANYGGPLLDIEGRVIGICVPLNPMSKEVSGGVEWYDSGIGFAASLHGMENVLTAMKAGKTIQPGSLGVQVKAADANGSGAVIAQVLEKSGAEKAGLKPEDRLLAVAGDAVLDVAQLRTLVSRYAAGDEVKLTIRRGEEELQITVTLQIPVDPQPMPKPAAEAKPEEKKPAEKPAE